MLYHVKKLAEVNIQAECYHQLRLLGIKTCLEYKTRTADGQGCQFDMVVLKELEYNQYEIIAIVEFKNHKKEYDFIEAMKTKQYYKYSSFGIPLIYCRRREELQSTVDKIVQLINNN